MKFMYMTTTRITKALRTAFIVAAGLAGAPALAQDSTKKETTFYTFVYNQVPESCSYPVIGLVNMAEGNQHGFQLGFTNINQKNFKGTQIGFTNVVGGTTKGSQIGFINAGKDSLKGAQVGYVNIVTDKVDGAQIGFINVSKNSVEGAQIGYVNVASEKVKGAQVAFVNINIGETQGSQVGYVNIATENTKGAQVGFVNATVKESKGSQVGFVNVAGTSNGSQIGFINVADSIGSGVPIGFISIAGKGGYYALEASTNELYPTNLSFKIGTPHFYTLFTGSYNPDFKQEYAIGAGFGSKFQLSRRFYFNPEVMIQNTVTEESQMFLSFAPNLGFSLSDHWSLVAGPSVVWSHLDNDNNKEDVLYKPSFTLYENNIDARNRVHVGARFAIRYKF
jgi:hypothetical protein